MLSELAGFFKDKKVFITGHTGFKGSWMLACLHLFDAKIKGYALAPNYKNGLYDILRPHKIGESIIADIRNKTCLKEEIVSFQPDFIFHLAAQPLVRRSYEIPAETFDVNVIGTANLLEAVNELKNKCTVIVITTDKVYENKEKDILYNEKDALGGFDPYSASKACAELVISSWRNSFFNFTQQRVHQKAIASARAGNVIGGGDWSKDRIIPDIINSLHNQKEILIRNPNSVRPWQHVMEPILGYLRLAISLDKDPLLFSKAYNFGPLPKDHLPVRDLVKKAIELWGSGSWKDSSETNPPHEAGLLKLDISLAQKELNWHPKLDSLSAIRWAVEWYKQPIANQASFTFQQIKEYFVL